MANVPERTLDYSSQFCITGPKQRCSSERCFGCAARACQYKDPSHFSPNGCPICHVSRLADLNLNAKPVAPKPVAEMKAEDFPQSRAFVMIMPNAYPTFGMEIIKTFFECQFSIIHAEFGKIDKDHAKAIFSKYIKGKERTNVVNRAISGHSMCMVVERYDAVVVARSVASEFNKKFAFADHIAHRFLHVADTEENAKQELKVFWEQISHHIEK